MIKTGYDYLEKFAKYSKTQLIYRKILWTKGFTSLYPY